MMYSVKLLIGVLTTPLTIALFIALTAGIFRALRRQRTATWLSIAAVSVAYLASLVPVGDALLGPLERQYPPLSGKESLAAVRYVVVLGSGYLPRDGIPITAALDVDGLVRIVEGVRLVRRLPGAQLVVSGGASADHVPAAHGYAALASALGIANSTLVVLDSPRDTSEEARTLVATIGQAPFLLVTSAGHMPRAMRLMERATAHPIAAPTGYRVDGSRKYGWRSLLPRAAGLDETERALHEYLGLAALVAGIP